MSGGEKRVDGLFRLRVEQSRVSSIDFLGILSIFSSVSGGGRLVYTAINVLFFSFLLGYTADRIVYGKKQKDIHIFRGGVFFVRRFLAGAASRFRC